MQISLLRLHPYRSLEAFVQKQAVFTLHTTEKLMCLPQPWLEPKRVQWLLGAQPMGP